MADDPFWSNLFKRRSRGETELFDVLSKVPIFQDLSRREFDRIEGILHRRSFSIDEYIVKEGDVGVGMYIILSGEVRIVHLSADGEELVLTTFGGWRFLRRSGVAGGIAAHSLGGRYRAVRCPRVFPARFAGAHREQSAPRAQNHHATLPDDIYPTSPDEPVAQGGPRSR